MEKRLGIVFFLMISWLGLSAGIHGGNETAQEVPYALPEFEIGEVPEGMPWRYAKMDDIEILSLCDDRVGERTIAALQRGRALFPKVFQPEKSSPWSLLLFDRASSWSGSKIEANARSMGDRRLGSPGAWLHHGGGIRAYDGDMYVRAERFDQMTLVSSVQFDIAMTALWEIRPQPPAWLREGLFGRGGLYRVSGVFPDRDGMRFASLFWMDERETKGITRQPDSPPTLVPLDQFFNMFVPSQETAPKAYALWESQSWLFVHWAMLAKKKPDFSSTSLWQFARISQHRKVSESDFRQCFGRDFTTALDELRAYLPMAVKAGKDMDVPGLHAIGKDRRLVFRAATEAEVARIKGNFERMQAKDYRQRAPTLAARYEAAARRSFDRGMRFGSADNQIVGALGLLEYETGHPDKARGYLERAYTTGDLGTRGLLALADLRWREMTTGLTAEGKLPAEALERVLDPLFAARERKPAVIETYQMLADVWERSGFPPTRNHLAVLVEGVEFFPTDETLRARTVRLHEVHGYRDILAGLAEIR